MCRDYLRPALLIFASIAIGVVGWSGHVLLLPVVLGFPLLWSISRTRFVAALVSAGYFPPHQVVCRKAWRPFTRRISGRACCSGCVRH